MGILNGTQGYNILAQLKKDDYKRCLQIIEKSIMATDLAVFMGNQVLFK